MPLSPFVGSHGLSLRLKEEGWVERGGERGRFVSFKSFAFQWVCLGEQSFTASSRRWPGVPGPGPRSLG